MEQFLTELTIRTEGEGFINITDRINHWIKENEIQTGLLVITSKHTSCSLIINENADPRVLQDLSSYFKAIVPEIGFKSISGEGEMKRYLHKEEGIDDMPAHIRTILTSTSLTLSIINSRLDLGTWQAVYLWEHRYSDNNRKVNLHAIAEKIKVEPLRNIENINSILAKTNASKLNRIVMHKQENISQKDDGDQGTEMDLIIDRIHEITGENN
ncbi:MULTISPECIES: secondary thiamine-phosphate synthase enzyme YjbQ [unclassified Prochlorococcus]|uniref:secondary thiamine-phosphate synthase enzyme YjbQ n=1 Tax=unclassified Prochlorococcus TaxID=2627481 RepID=UPI000533ACF3|nr:MULTISPECIES: secondary thiamine-phosphate synthase enzyme YjbQ [unclassified Prochlorococcus]KGG16467.1 hypothetical protein EV06_0304 [Prochlorococcus sp. MIT 0602]KGG17059.1 hypothetical protein EV07_0489 [Prochlorococcus sp. MIT 0603]